MSSERSSALLVIDLIEDYFDPEIWPASAIPALKNHFVDQTNQLVKSHRNSGGLVYWINQEFNHDLSNAFPHMIIRGQRYAVSGTPGSQLLSQLDVQKSDYHIPKTRFSAFFGTPLYNMLINDRVTGVVIAGITTSWCIRATATDAYQHGLDVRLVTDCVAGFDQETHQNALDEMLGFIASGTTVQELVSGSVSSEEN